MAEEMVFAQGDDLPTVSAILSDATGPLNLTDCTVTFEALIAGVTVSTACDVQAPATDGHVHFEPSNETVATKGSHTGRYKVVYLSGKVLHVPNDSQIRVVVT